MLERFDMSPLPRNMLTLHARRSSSGTGPQGRISRGSSHVKCRLGITPRTGAKISIDLIRRESMYGGPGGETLSLPTRAALGHCSTPCDIMRRMQTLFRVVAQTAFTIQLLATVATAETIIDGRRTVVVESPAATLLIDLGGGSIVDFHLSGGGLNPLHWLGPGDEHVILRPMAHFLCLDRWGPPSEAEQQNGMQFHGEASRVEWKERRASEVRGAISAAMSAYLPIAGLEIQRSIRLADSAAVAVVSETVTNRNKLGRIYNMVQHATIGPPFLDETTLVDSNAGRGLMQSSPLPNPEQIEIRWPEATKDGNLVDLRRLTTDADPNVVSFVVDGDVGWVTATNASKELLLGYIFSTADYPWLNLWRHVQGGRPLARGLEFGTTGLHQPFKILTAKPQIFGKPTFAYLDSGESVTRRFTAFLTKIPKDFSGVGSVTNRDGMIIVQERSGSQREITINVGRLP